jgi:HK97 family phage major capsid protein
MTIAANLTTGNLPNTYRSGIVGQPYEMVHLRDLVVVTPSATDSYHFYRHNVGEGAINWQVQELATKQQIDENLAEQTVNLDYLAGWLRISRKMLRNFSGLQAYITRWLPEKYYQVEDTKGYQALISAATGVADSSGTDTISVIIRTIGLQKKAKYNVNGIVVDGVTWARILTYKASTSGEFTMPIGVVSISPSGVLMICGVPVYVASWVGGDEAIIGDWRYFEIIQSEGLSLQFFEQDGTNVRENKITVRIEASVGFAMLDPLAFVVASLESVS